MKEVSFSKAVKEVHFDSWVLDPKRQTISNGDIERELEPLLFNILSYLILNSDEIITRQDLVDDVWCQNYVDDNAINRAMSELRKVLKSEKQRGVIVKTHYRKGYSFFLEPHIIYHQEVHEQPPVDVSKTTEIDEVTDAKVNEGLESNKPKKTNLPKWVYVSAFIFVTICLYSYTHYLPSKEVATEITKKDVDEKVLSWVRGRYTHLSLSFDKALVAFSFAPHGSKYYSLVIKELDTGKERRLGEEGVNYYPLGWSVDSTTLYYRMKADQQCQIWQISADFNSDNKALFDCSMSGFTRGSGLGNDRLVYSKLGYRNRDELSALANRNLITGEEFQISSPNLNSYGDQFLAYIPEKEVILFERRQYDTNELFVTDPDGGNQVKLLDSHNRIWALSYDSDADLLLWFDITTNTIYGYDLDKRKLVKEDKLNRSKSYALYQFIDENELLIVSSLFKSSLYNLDIKSKEMTANIRLGSGDRSPIKYKDGYFVVTHLGDKRVVTQISANGKSAILDIPGGNINSLRYNELTDILLVQYDRKILVYKYSDLSLIDTLMVENTIVSVEFLGSNDIGYVVLNSKKNKSNSYVYSFLSKKKSLIPIPSSLWVGHLGENTLISLSSDDKVFLYDIATGNKLVEYELPTSRYKHSLAVGEQHIYHSDGERIYQINKSNFKDSKEIFKLDRTLYNIRSINYLGGELQLNVYESAENQLMNLSIHKL